MQAARLKLRTVAVETITLPNAVSTSVKAVTRSLPLTAETHIVGQCHNTTLKFETLKNVNGCCFFLIKIDNLTRPLLIQQNPHYWLHSALWLAGLLPVYLGSVRPNRQLDNGVTGPSRPQQL